MSLLYYMLCQLRGSKAIWYAGMAELADAHGSGPCDYCSHEGSSPFSCIVKRMIESVLYISVKTQKSLKKVVDISEKFW